MNRRSFCRSIAAASAGWVVLGWRSNPAPIRRATLTMGSLLDIQVFCSDVDHAHHAMQRAFDEFHRLDDQLSVFKTTSLISTINMNAGRSGVRVPEEVLHLFLASRRFQIQTGGQFNILVEPLMRLWGFREAPSSGYPTDAEIERAVLATKADNVIIVEKDCTIGLSSREASIDLGGIAVGFALDRAASILKSEGIDQALLNHSGDLLAIGAPPDHEAWNVGITNPENTNEVLLETTLSNSALSTSGNYESFQVIDSHRIGHLFDPRSGRNPREYLSISVKASTALEADALSTGCFCGGTFSKHCEYVALLREENGTSTLQINW